MGTNKLKKNNGMYKIYKYGGIRKTHRGYGYSEYRPAGCRVPKYVHLVRTFDCNDSPWWCYPFYVLGWMSVVNLSIWSIYTRVTHLSDYWWCGVVAAGLIIVGILMLWNLSPCTPGRKLYVVRIYDKRDIPKLKKRFVIRFRLISAVIMCDRNKK